MNCGNGTYVLVNASKLNNVDAVNGAMSQYKHENISQFLHDVHLSWLDTVPLNLLLIKRFICPW